MKIFVSKGRYTKILKIHHISLLICLVWQLDYVGFYSFLSSILPELLAVLFDLDLSIHYSLLRAALIFGFVLPRDSLTFRDMWLFQVSKSVIVVAVDAIVTYSMF